MACHFFGVANMAKKQFLFSFIILMGLNGVTSYTNTMVSVLIMYAVNVCITSGVMGGLEGKYMFQFFFLI